MAAKIVKLGLPDFLGKGHVSIPCAPTDTFETIIEKGLRLAFQAKRSNELLDAKGFYVSVRKGNKDVTLVGSKTLATLGMDSERMIPLTLVPLDGAVPSPLTPPTPSSPSSHSSPPLSPLRTPSSHTLSSSSPPSSLSLGSSLSRTDSSNKFEGKKTKSPTAHHHPDLRTPPPPPPGDDDDDPPPPPPSSILTPSSFSPRTAGTLKKPLAEPPPPPPAPGGAEESDEESEEDVPGPPTSSKAKRLGGDVDPPPPPPEFDGAPPPPRAASPMGRGYSGKGSKLTGVGLEGSSGGEKRTTRRKKNSSVDSVGSSSSPPLSPSAKSAPGTIGPGIWHDTPGVCPGCGLGFGVGAIDAAMGKKFHSGHFICFHCGKNLANQKFFKHDGRPYCLDDEKKLFSNKCAECNKPITGDYMRVMGADYHTSCLRCVTCKTELRNKKYHAKDEKPYCEEHYHQLFGTICVGCGKPILEKILRALDAPWHVACFMCSHCLKPLDGTQFFLKNDNVYCPKDHEALFALRCKGCEQVIKGRYEKVEALNQNFHSQCLVCSVCQVPLSGKSVYSDDRSDEVYCKEHYEATDAIKCAVCHEYIRKEVLHAFDKAYHPDCYICKECKRPATRHVKDTLFCDYHGQNAPKKGAPAPPPPPITSEVAKMYDDDDDDDDDEDEKEGKDEDPDSSHHDNTPDNTPDGAETETETEVEDPEEEERERKEKKREEEEKIKRAAELKQQEEEKKQRAEQTKKLNAEREKVRAKQEATRLEEEDRKRRETQTKSQARETERKKALDELKQQEAVYERQLAELAKQDAEAQSKYDKIRQELEEEERRREAAKAAKKAKKAEKKKQKGGTSKGQTTTKKARGGIRGHMGHLSAFISYGVSQCCPLKETPYRADYRRKDIYKPQLNNIDYDFLDFAPKIFQDIRERFGISQKAYVDSMVKQGISGGDTGAGKSGMLFFFSNDRKYVVKTITKTELKFTRKILKSYHEHMKANPHSLISRFYGLYKITMRDQKPLRLIVMNNLFDTSIKIHEKFDLKGSIRNRYVPDTESKDSHKGVLKDLNYKSKMYVGVTQKQVLTHQIKKDCEFLTKENIMDQSLLLGVHNGSEETDPSKGKAITQISMKLLKNPLTRDPSRPDSGDLISIFQTNHMGIRGFDDNGVGAPVPRKEIYYMGVIDILQNFNLKKQLESTYKGIRYNKNAISAVSSKKYAERFMEYLFAHFV